MNCPACGAENREGARFCRGCGRKLDVQTLPEAGERAVGGPPIEAEQEAVTPPETPAAGTTEPLAEVVAVGAGTAATAIEGPGDRAEAPGAGEERMVEAQADEKDRIVQAAAEQMRPDVAAVPEGSESQGPIVAEPLALAGAGEGQVPSEGDQGKVADDVLPAEVGEEILAFWREESEPMSPLALNTVIEERFAVAEVLDMQVDQILYRAHDLTRCWQCGFEENDPAGVFCVRCGVLMDRRPDVRLLEIREGKEEAPNGQVVLARLSHDSRHLLLLAEREPVPEPEAPAVAQGIRLLVGQRSDVGQVRELDEDSLFVLTLSPTYESRTAPVLGLFAVADGMGGHASGEIASRMALQVLVDSVMRMILVPELAGELVLEDEILALLRQATIAANDAVYLARQKREIDMGTTLTTALIRDNRLFLAHVGDCRAYRWNPAGLEQLTSDHSVIARMIADGQARPEELYTHPHRSIVYRCIGDKAVVDVDADMLPLIPGDRIILCCDGLWEMVRDEGIEDVMMQEADPQAACDLLVRRANAAGGEDNISVIVVQVEAVKGLED